MTLSNTTFTSITISSTLLDSFIANPSSYIQVQVIGDITCSGTTTTKTYTSTSPITGSTDVRTSTGVETIVPNFFGLTTFGNGIYSFTVELTSITGNTTKDRGCIFIDVDVKCNIPAECLDKQMLHYTLTQSQSCDCDCNRLCEILNTITDSTTDNDCNC